MLGSQTSARHRQTIAAKLLGTLCLGFFEDERDAFESWRLIED